MRNPSKTIFLGISLGQMEVLHKAGLGSLSSSSSFSLTQPRSSSSPTTRPISSYAPISSASLVHNASADRPLQRCSSPRCGVALKAAPIKGAPAKNPISASRDVARSLLFNNDNYAKPSSASSTRATIKKKSLIVMRNNAAAGYAAALAEIGQSKHILNLIYADLKKLGSFLQHKQLHSFLLNPSIHDTHKKNILMRLGDDYAFVPYTVKLLNLVVDKKRTSLLKDVVKEFEVIYNKIVDTEAAVVLSATEMDVAQLVQVAKRIQGMPSPKSVQAKNILDSAVVAGYIVKYGNA